MVRRPVLALLLLSALASGCGHADGRQDTGAAPVGNDRQFYGERSLGGKQIARPRDADFGRPIAAYRRHVVRELDGMLDEVGALSRATRSGDLSGARAAWLRALARYESIGAAYGAFGPLDAAINGRPGGLPGGTGSPDFTGLHRIELALFRRGSTADAAPFASRLAADVRRLQQAVGGALDIAPLDYALRAHEILEDSLHLQLSGVATPWSGAALTALKANLASTRVVLETLSPLIAPRDTAGTLRASELALDRLDDGLRAVARAHGGDLPRWDRVRLAERQRIDALTAAAAETLAFVPEIVDPRPPLPLQAG